MSREKHNIIIILDSSPSCSRYANFYGKIASQCVQYGDVELYDGPNARLVHIYKPREKSFVTFLTAEDIFNNVHEWSLFKNRTIIFFGDSDGLYTVLKNTVHNKVYYFYTHDEDSFQYDLKDHVDYGYDCNTKNLTRSSVLICILYMTKLTQEENALTFLCNTSQIDPA